jgi:hypothetical protein
MNFFPTRMLLAIDGSAESGRAAHMAVGIAFTHGTPLVTGKSIVESLSEIYNSI